MSRLKINNPALRCTIATLLGFLFFSPARTASAVEPVDFAHDVVPILKKHCAECHTDREAKGGFSFNTRELLLELGHVEPGSPDDSYLVDLIVSDDPDMQMPPRERPRVSTAEIQLLWRWIEEDLPWEAGYSFAPPVYEPPLKPRRPELPPAVDGRTNPIDRILDAWLREHDLPRPAPIDDATFLRRASLDLVGLLPEPETLDTFLKDSGPEKRARQVVSILNHDIAYADHWLTFFNDLLRNDYSGTGFLTSGRFQISTWLYDSLLENKPYDVMARELLAPTSPESRGYIDGIRWRGTVSAAQQVEVQFAQNISQTFLGLNLKCASCHDSFIDRWKLEEAYGLAAIYSDHPLEIHRCDKSIGKEATPGWLFPELGNVDGSAPRDDRLAQLAALMTHPENGRFTRTIVNRLWYRLMGRGIVHPLDAMQTPPWNEDLLDELAVYFTDHNYNLKSVLELIATSRAYQSQCAIVHDDVVDQNMTYHGPQPRRMIAEQYLDSIWQLTGAAPKLYDAPVFRALIDDEAAASIELQGEWISSETDDESRANHNQVVFHKSFSLPSPVQMGAAVMACDAPFSLYVNGRLVGRGAGGCQLYARPMHDALAYKELKVFVKGDMFTVIADVTESDTASPQFYLEARLLLESGEELRVVSDESWEGIWASPEVREGLYFKMPENIRPVKVEHKFDPSDSGMAQLVRQRLAQAVPEEMPMVRASLMKNEFFMKSLGRPGREQIVSMRPQELSTLEALQLSNGPELYDALKLGADRLLTRFPENSRGLVNYFFEYALSRHPTDAEWQVIQQNLGEAPSQEKIADLLWSVCLSPEFLFIR